MAMRSNVWNILDITTISIELCHQMRMHLFITSIIIIYHISMQYIKLKEGNNPPKLIKKLDIESVNMSRCWQM